MIRCRACATRLRPLHFLSCAMWVWLAIAIVSCAGGPNQLPTAPLDRIDTTEATVDATAHLLSIVDPAFGFSCSLLRHGLVRYDARARIVGTQTSVALSFVLGSGALESFRNAPGDDYGTRKGFPAKFENATGGKQSFSAIVDGTYVRATSEVEVPVQQFERVVSVLSRVDRPDLLLSCLTASPNPPVMTVEGVEKLDIQGWLSGNRVDEFLTVESCRVSLHVFSKSFATEVDGLEPGTTRDVNIDETTGGIAYRATDGAWILIDQPPESRGTSKASTTQRVNACVIDLKALAPRLRPATLDEMSPAFG